MGVCDCSNCIHLIVVTPNLPLIEPTRIRIFTQNSSSNRAALPPPPCALDADCETLVLSSPVSSTRAARQAKAEASRFRLWRWVEKSRMESSHSPNPRRHWNLCSTKPLQNTNLSSVSVDLRCRKEGKEKTLRPPLSKIKAQRQGNNYFKTNETLAVCMLTQACCTHQTRVSG